MSWISLLLASWLASVQKAQKHHKLIFYWKNLYAAVFFPLLLHFLSIFLLCIFFCTADVWTAAAFTIHHLFHISSHTLKMNFKIIRLFLFTSLSPPSQLTINIWMSIYTQLTMWRENISMLSHVLLISFSRKLLLLMSSSFTTCFIKFSIRAHTEEIHSEKKEWEWKVGLCCHTRSFSKKAPSSYPYARLMKNLFWGILCLYLIWNYESTHLHDTCFEKFN